LKAELKARPNRLGIYVAAGYVLIVAGVYAVTAYGGKPSGLGYEWIPFIELAMPWAWIDERLPSLIFGFIVNAGILYLLGTFFEKFRRRLFWK